MAEAGKKVLLNNKRLPFLFFLAISLICLVYSAENKWSGNNWKTIITSDGSGYYAYLPCIFIYHNFDFGKLESLNKGLSASCYQKSGKIFDKYFIGVAVLLTPFFLIAYFLSYLFGFSCDGYSLLFQLGAAAGGLFYLITGLVFTRKLLLEYKIKEGVIYFTLGIALFATNLFYYSAIEPTMSHVYSFALVAVFIYYAKRFSTGAHTGDFWKLACAFCLLVLVRPVNIFCILLIPFIAGSAGISLKFIRNALKAANLAVLIVFAGILIALQLLVWHAETGSFIIKSYSAETFYFTRPHFWSVLFGFRKGWYIYTPVMFVATFGGLTVLYRKNIFSFFSFLLFFIPFTYILSCWWCWYYGDSYGMRVFIDLYAVFALLLALFLNTIPIKPVYIYSCIIVSLFLVLLNCVQQYQYMNLILSRDSMSRGRYRKVFLKTDARYKGIFYNTSLNDLEYFDELNFTNDFEHNAWGADNNITSLYAHSGMHSAFVDAHHIYGPFIALKAADLPFGADLYARFDMWIYSLDTVNEACMVINSLEPDGSSDGWVPLPIKTASIPPQWTHIEGTLHVPFIKTPDNTVKLFLYYSGGRGAVYVDDLNIRFGRPE